MRPPRKVQYHPHIYFQGLLLSSFESPQKHTHVCLSGKPMCSFKDCRETARPRFEFALRDTRWKYHERKQMRPLTLICKVVLFLFFFFNQTVVAFLSLYFKLECFDKFPRAEVKWSFVLKWVTWRVNAKRSAIHFPIWKESPQLSCPLRAPQKRDWLSTDGRKAWQSMPKESSLGGRGLRMWKHWQYPIAHSLPMLLHVRPVGN